MAEVKFKDLMTALEALFNDKEKLKEIRERIEKEKMYENIKGADWRKMFSERWEEARRVIISLRGFYIDERFNPSIEDITVELAIPQSK